MLQAIELFDDRERHDDPGLGAPNELRPRSLCEWRVVKERVCVWHRHRCVRLSESILLRSKACGELLEH